MSGYFRWISRDIDNGENRNGATPPTGPKYPELHAVAPFYAMAVATVIPTWRMITQPVLRLPLSSIIATECPRCKVFIRFHERDIAYKDRFVKMMQGYMLDKSVDTGDIVGCNLPLDEVRHRIRDVTIADATVTVVLVGRCTW